jgi:hypothetical protein
MEQLRSHRPEGEVVAKSADGTNFVSVSDDTLFARRVGVVFRMADGSIGTLGGHVVFMQNAAGKQYPAFWLESVPDSSLS